MKINTQSWYRVEDVNHLMVPLFTHAALAPRIPGQIKATEVHQCDRPQHQRSRANDPKQVSGCSGLFVYATLCYSNNLLLR